MFGFSAYSCSMLYEPPMLYAGSQWRHEPDPRGEGGTPQRGRGSAQEVRRRRHLRQGQLLRRQN